MVFAPALEIESGRLPVISIYKAVAIPDDASVSPDVIYTTDTVIFLGDDAVIHDFSPLEVVEDDNREEQRQQHFTGRASLMARTQSIPSLATLHDGTLTSINDFDIISQYLQK